MKYIREKFLDFLSPSWRERFVFNDSVEKVDALPKQPEEKTDLIDFRYKHVDEMDRAFSEGKKYTDDKGNKVDSIEHICGSHEHFQTLVEHQLRLVENTSGFEKSFPPRILYGIHVSHHLKAFLTREQVKRIEKIFEDEKKDVAKLLLEKANSSTGFSQGEIIQLAAFYEAFSTGERTPKYDVRVWKEEEVKKHGEDKKAAHGEHENGDKEVLENEKILRALRKVLIRQALTLLTRARVADTTDAVSFTLEEKLLLLEIYRVFPNEDDWDVEEENIRGKGDKFDKENVVKLLRHLSGEIQEEVCQGTDKEEYSLFWDTLEDFAQKENIGDKKVTSGETETTLRSFLHNRVRRVNAAKLVAFSQRMQLLLPEEVIQLQELAMKDDDFKPSDFKKHQEGEKKELEEMDDLRKQLDIQLKIIRDLDDTLLPKAPQKGEDKLDKVNIDQVKRDELRDLRAKWIEALETRQGSFDAFKTSVEGITEDPRIASYVGEVGIFITKRGEISDNVSDKIRRKLEGVLKEITLTNEQKDKLKDLFQSFFDHDVYNNIIDSKEKFIKALKAVDTSFAAYREEVEGKIRALESEIKAKGKTQAEKNVAADMLEHVHERARTSVENYKERIRFRSVNHALLQEDFDLLMRTETEVGFPVHNDDMPAATAFMNDALGEETVKTLKEIRKKVFTVLEGRIDTELVGKFKSNDAKDWEASVQNAFRVENILAKIKEGNPKFLDELRELGCLPSEIIDGAIIYFRSKIEKTIEKELEGNTASEDKKREFIANIRRLHGPIRKGRDVEALMERVSDVRTRMKDTVNSVIQKEHNEVLTLAENNARKEIEKIAEDEKYAKGFQETGKLQSIIVDDILGSLLKAEKLSKEFLGAEKDRESRFREILKEEVAKVIARVPEEGRKRVFAVLLRMHAVQNAVRSGSESIREGHVIEVIEEKRMTPEQLKKILSEKLETTYSLDENKPEDIAKDLSVDSAGSEVLFKEDGYEELYDKEELEKERISNRMNGTYFGEHFKIRTSAEEFSRFQKKEEVAVYCRDVILPQEIIVRQLRQAVIDEKCNSWCRERFQRLRTEMLAELVYKCEGKNRLEVDGIVLEAIVKDLFENTPSPLDTRSFKDIKSTFHHIFCKYINQRNQTIEGMTDALWAQKEENKKPTLAYIPGTEELYVLERETLPYHEKAVAVIGDFEKRISAISVKLDTDSHGHSPHDDIDKLFHLWSLGGEQQVQSQIDATKATLDGIFPGNDAEHGEQYKALKEKFSERIDHVWNGVCEEFERLEIKSHEGELKATDFSILASRLSQLKNVMNIANAPWQKELGTRLWEHSNFEINAETLKQLRAHEAPEEELEGAEKDIYEADGMNLKKAKETFRQNRADFNTKFSNYKNKISDVTQKIYRDIEGYCSLDNQDFADRYGMSKDAVKKELAKLQSSDGEFDTLWDKFNKTDKTGESEFWTEFEKTWNDSLKGGDRLQKKAEAMNMLTGWQDVVEHIGDMEKSANAWSNWIEKYEKNEKEKFLFSGVLHVHKRHFGVKYIALYQFYDVVKKTLEARDRLWKRKMDYASAHFGADIFGDTRVGKEFFRMGEHSEDERVDEYKHQYNHQSIATLWEAMEHSHDHDEVRALITLLNEKGVLMWDDPILWRALMNMGHSSEHFNIPGDMSLPYGQIRDKVKKMASEIWSYEIFRQWDISLDDNAIKNQKGFDGEFTGYETTDKNARTKNLAEMLQKWSRGEVETDDKVKAGAVDPAKYEAFLSFAFRDGKMNGQPDQRWYFIAQGIATVNPKNNRPLLSRAALSRLNSQYLARFPHIDFFVDKDSYKLDGRIVPEGTPGAEQRLWTFEDYKGWKDFLGDSGGTFDPREGEAAENTKRFFYEIVQSSVTAGDRNHRMLKAADQFDHDDAASWGCTWTYREVCNHLGRESNSKEKSSADFWRTFLSGFDDQLKYTWRLIQERDDDPIFNMNPKWHEQKKRMLLQLGNSLRSNITATQALFGNYVTYADKNRATVYGNEELDKPTTGYSPAIKESRQHVNKFAELVFEKSGAPGKFHDILHFNGYEYGKSTAELEKRPEWVRMADQAEELVNDGTANAFFRNPANIEKALREYCGG